MGGFTSVRAAVVRLVVFALVASTVVAVRDDAAGAAPTRSAAGSGRVAPAWSGRVSKHGSPARTAALASTSGDLAAATAGSGESELVGLRTQASRTFVEPDGTRRLVAATHPLNYRGVGGAWQPIDDSLVADTVPGFAWRNTADSYTAQFPADLSAGPVRVSASGQWVQFQLRSAQSAVGVVSGNTITYRNAEPGVDLTYAALPTGLKESLTLASASATASFTFDVSTSSGITSKSAGGVTAYSDGSGPLFFLANPWVADASGDEQDALSNVSLNLAASDAHHASATVAINGAWLADGTRQFPVTVDPTLIRSGTDITDCYMSSTHPSSNYCGRTYVRVGYSNDPGDLDDIRRGLVQFDVSAIPGDSFVQDADLQLYLTSLTGTGPLPVEALQNCTDWNSSVTWNSPDGTGSWSGGDPCNSQLFQNSVSSVNTWYHWHVTPVVQTWVNGGPGDAQSVPNRGLLLRRHGTSTVALAEFSSAEAASNTPLMTVYYTAMVGTTNSATNLQRNLTGHAALGVNPATGNVMLQTSDLNVHGTGVNYQLQHVYNSRLAKQQLASPDSGPTEGLSAGWTVSTGNDVFLRRYGAPGAVFVMHMPDGSWIRFYRHGTDSAHAWSDDQVASPGVQATLHTGSGTPDVVFHNSGIKYVFTDTGGSGPYDSTLSSIKDKHGQTITVNRAGGSASGAITSVSDTHGRSFTYTHTSGVLSQVTDVAGSRSVSFTPDNQNRLGSFTDAAGKDYVYGYDTSSGLLNSITTPGNRSISVDYDSQGRIYHLSRSTAPGDSCTSGTTNTWTYAYITPDGGQPSTAVGETTITDPSGAVTKYYYDAQRRIVRVIDPQTRKRTTDYDTSTGMVTTYTDNLYNSYSLIYDTNRNLNSITAPVDSGDPSGMSISYTYNSNDGTPGTSTGSDQTNPTSMTDTAGNVTTYGLSGDRNDIVATTDQASGHGITIDYNNSGNSSPSYLYGTIDKVHDQGGNITQYLYYDQSTNSGYNQADLKTIQTPGPQGDKQFSYDNDSRVQVVTDGAGRTTTYEYDALDRITKVTFGDSTFIQYTYDDDDNVLTRRDRSGQTTTIDYDGYNRPVTQHEPWRVPSLTDSFCYDARDNLTQLSDAGGTAGYDYNNASDLTTVTEPGGSGCSSYSWTGTLPATNSRCIVFDYDNNARRDGTAYPGGVKQQLFYRNSGLIKEVKTTQGATTLVDLNYDYSIGSGSTAIQTDMRQKVTDALRSNTTSYSYDTENRLKDATQVETSASATTHYSYFYGARNRTSQTIGSGTPTKYGYNEDNELCRSKDTTTSYSGCTTGSGDTEYAYDGAGNLTSSGSYPNDTGLFAATYNPAGQTASMTDLTGANSTSMDYTDIGQNQRVQAGSLAFTNTILGMASSQPTSGTLTAYTRDQQGHLLSYRVGNTPSSSTNHYYLLDSIGTVLGTTDATGTRDATYYYDPFGLTTSATGTASSADNRFGFASGWLDPTGLYHYGQRYYSPTLGRWSQPDPIAGTIDAPKNINRYIYTGDDPINNVDPSGENWFSDAVGIVVGAFAGAACEGASLGLGMYGCGIFGGAVGVGAAHLTDWLFEEEPAG